MSIYNTYIPENFASITPYLITENPVALIDFVKNAFDAVETSRTTRPDGTIANCILNLGTASIMIAQAKGILKASSTGLYLYVNDVDGVHRKALQCGAKEIFPPDNMEYGDRQSGITDPAGNYWWISMRLSETNYGNH